MRRIHFILLSTLILVLLCYGVTPVLAHAVLVNSIPADNATLMTPPSQVELFFSETIDPNLSKVSVMDANGKRVDAADAHLDPSDGTHMIVSLTKLGDGVYTVMWTAVSATDGHQTTGSFPFAVGNMTMGSMTVAPTTPTSGTFTGGIIFTKVLLYLSTATIIGALLFTFLVWKPSLRIAKLNFDDLPAYVIFSQKLLIGALVLLITADVLSLFAQAGQVSGQVIGWPWNPEFRTVLLNTRFGALVIARLGLAFILAGLLLPKATRWNRYLALAICPLLLLTFSLESHAASEPLPTLPILSDWVHFAAISVWVGGLISFLGAVWAINKLTPTLRTSLTAVLIPHFTVLAMSSVGALMLTGIYSAYLRIGSLTPLIGTTYGRVLLLKLLVIAPMLAMGGFHFLVTTPLMKRAAGESNGSLKLVKLFRGLLSGETVLGLLVLILVAILTTLAPVRAVATSAGYARTIKVNDLKVSLNIAPGHAGMNTFTATITSNGKPVVDAKDVSLEFSSVSGMMAASKAAMDNMGDGVYSLRGGYLGMADQWDVKVVVRRTGQFDAYAGFSVPISQAVSGTIPWQPITTGLFVATLVWDFLSLWLPGIPPKNGVGSEMRNML
jgi:copper transport protein